MTCPCELEFTSIYIQYTLPKYTQHTHTLLRHTYATVSYRIRHACLLAPTLEHCRRRQRWGRKREKKNKNRTTKKT